MSTLSFLATAGLLSCSFLAALAQTPSSFVCSTTLTPTNSIKPSVASGYKAALVATGLTRPRSIQFDGNGNLLVVEAGAGVSNLKLQDSGGTCITVRSKTNVIQNSSVSSPAGK